MAEEDRDTRERIIEATSRALTASGYADLTMADIAAESDTSTALLHYHFDTKEDLLVDFLDQLVDDLEADLHETTTGDPMAGLEAIIDLFVFDETEAERKAFHQAMLELRTQAPYNERVQQRFRRADRLVRDALTAVLTEEAIAYGGTPVKPTDLATMIVATMDGARSRQLLLGEPDYAATVKDVVLAQFFDHRTERPDPA